ncbi:carcinoembryonic antigen-related cell adhesion molecule 5-like isoform X1 [Sinocyclocheilus anshuiensis]|uniref:Carcinoembryonic antigen-related cell adhesion molecule 5-like n=1 Tax=Sinocyclocheilus anshuiensis TaxID=1608454 RepID=A0A671ND49_9TELE|nr:PREDICTED: carcinoembryonic antigen-related cell adhesion molecule 5-like isoform X1 [Sinocyclocheilus anshuiensis]
MGHTLLTLFFTLMCTSGLYAVFLVPSQNPVAVGSNVTISVNDTQPILFGLWLFESSTLFVWYPGEVFTGSGHQNGTEFDISTYQLTLPSVTLKNSGLYALDALRPKARAVITLDVQEPVSNLTAFVSMTTLVELNDTVTFTCSASGTPLWFSWQNGSSTVTAGGRVELRNGGRDFIINGVMRYDEGPFKCLVANNISKRESHQMNLNISYGPSNLRVTASPEKSVYIAGLVISLSCSADSKPTATFYWMYNGNPLNVYGPSYDLSDTTQNRTGEYTCVAQNAVTLRHVAVTKKIDILDPISAVAVNPAGSPVEGMAFNLNCNVVGPVNSIHWMKNGIYLDADNMITFSNDNSTLRFNRLTLSDDGPYQCAASNAVSNMTSLAYNLMVNYGPNNTAASGSKVAAVGSSATFSCSSDSRPQSQYSWYFSGLKVKNGSVYVTTPLSKNDSGQYTCMAFNSITGRSSNASVTLTVYAPVIGVMVNMDNQQPIFNQPFTLTCTVSGDVQHIQWMKNGVNLNHDNRINFTNNDSVLNFNPLTLSDNGQYQCEASNAINNMTSLAFDLKVIYGPWNTTISGPTVGAIGHNVTFHCSANSHPPSQYSWFLNSSKVGEGPVYTRALSPDSGGRYTCMASNNITGHSSNASLELTLRYPISHVIVNAGNQHPVFNQLFTLTCTTNGDVEHIQWMKNGMFLHPHNGITFSNNNSTMSFQNINLSDDGYYQCEASNAVSLMTSLAYDLMVNYGPWNTTVEGPIMAEMGSNVTFNCTAISRPHSQYSWFHNSLKVGDGPVHVTAALSLNSSGHYTCMAFNNITGRSSNASLALTVIEPIATVDVIPDRTIPLASQIFHLTCNVKGPYDTLHWLRNNQNLHPSDRVTFSADNAVVTFKTLQTADDGRYQCVASNALRQHVSHPYDLAVIFGPQSVQIIVRPGIPPILTCLAVSQPPAVYHWIFENNTVVGNQSSIELPIKSILGSNYTCVAKNPLTNVTVYTSQVVSYPNAAVSVQACVMLTALLALLLPVLEEWL